MQAPPGGARTGRIPSFRASNGLSSARAGVMPSGRSHPPPGVEQWELLGRHAERAQLSALVEGVRTGRSGSLLLYGEPGIGKTALLEDVVARAGRMPLLRANGVESETELPFSGLSQLLAPLANRLDELPPPQSVALAGALALGPPAPGDPLAVGVATLSLLALGAEDDGLLALVDDAHWMDAASLGALAFAARRLRAEGVGLLFSARTGMPSLLTSAQLPTLALGALTVASARELLARTAPGLAPGVTTAILELAQGNPLVLLEVPRALSEDELAGRRPLSEPLRAGVAVEHAFLRQIDAESDGVKRALLVAAAAEYEDGDVIRVALSPAGATAADLDRAERVGIISLEAGVRFRHPVLRASLYHSASSADRRVAHSALADTLEAQHEPHRVAWHRALAQATPDENVAGPLVTAAENARDRNAPAAAARALERAAELSPDPELRARRLLAAAENLILAGQVKRALELLEGALADTNDPDFRLDIQQVRGRTLAGTGEGLEAHALLTGEARRVEGTDPKRAAQLHTEAWYGAMVSGRPREGLASGERAFELAQQSAQELLPAAGLALAGGLIHAGQARRGCEVLDESIRAFEQLDPVLAFQPLMAAASFVGVLGREEEARETSIRLVRVFRALGAPGLLCLPLATLSHLEWRLGRWSEARLAGSEAVELGHSAGLEGFRLFALTGLARVEGSEGRSADCRAHGNEALDGSRQTGSETGIPYALAALVLGALGEAEVDEAVVLGTELARFYRERGYRSPGTFQWQGDVIEACVLSGRRDEAETLLGSFVEEAEATEHPWALAVSARCRGLLAGEDEFETVFAESLRLHEHVRMPFERARTELALGERRRRARRRADARGPLHRAALIFDSVGARPWAERTHAELRACGARHRRREPGVADELTPHELRVAHVIARGATNREAAAELFLSPKTIDFHLQQVYRKLGIHSRAELASRFARDNALEEVPVPTG